MIHAANVGTIKIPTQRKTELGMKLGKWERYWENVPSELLNIQQFH
jgi:hypothetical protein